MRKIVMVTATAASFGVIALVALTNAEARALAQDGCGGFRRWLQPRSPLSTMGAIGMATREYESGRVTMVIKTVGMR